VVSVIYVRRHDLQSRQSLTIRIARFQLSKAMQSRALLQEQITAALNKQSDEAWLYVLVLARKLDKSVHSGGQSAFCKLMVKARKALTQRELADRLHKPQSFVTKYEGGERRIDVVEFLTVCQAIGVDSAKLLKTLKKNAVGTNT
jgi:helix-turn-helix protein